MNSLWILMRGDEPFRAYFSENRAKEDFELTQAHQSEDVYWRLRSVTVIDSNDKVAKIFK